MYGPTPDQLRVVLIILILSAAIAGIGLWEVVSYLWNHLQVTWIP